MKIEEGVKQKGKFIEIPDCGRDDLPEFLKDTGRCVGAEIGVHEGEFSEKLCKGGLNVSAIDPWLLYSDYQRNQKLMDCTYKDAKERLEKYDNCKIIRKTSMEAIEDFEDDSLDFVYIDGNHWLKYAIEDIVEWTKKVKKGGVVAGHDYFLGKSTSCVGTCHVRYAIDAYRAAYRLNNFYILGRKAKIEGETRDQWRSWMFIKE